MIRHLLLLLTTLAFAGCAANTTNVGEEAIEAEPEPIVVPELAVMGPERGAFASGEVTVWGTTTTGTGALQTLTVNDELVALDDDGDWSHTFTPPPGLLLIGARLEDDLGQRAVDGRAVQVGATHPYDSVIQRSVGFQLGPEVLDDDDPDLDDLASIGASLASDPSVAEAFVGTTIPGSGYEVTLTSFHLDAVDLDIIPGTGGLQIDGYVDEVLSYFEADVLGFIPADGWAYMEQMVVSMGVEVTSTQYGISVTPSWVNVTLFGFDWDIDWAPEWVEGLLENTVRTQLEESIEEILAEMVGDLVADTLEAFEFDTEMADPDGGNAVHLQMKISGAEVHPEGLVAWMDTRMTASNPAFPLPMNAGSLKTDDKPPALPVKTDAPLAVVADDDFLNQVLFAYWHAGVMTQQQFSGPELLELLGEDLPPPLGPVTSASIDLAMPPVVSFRDDEVVEDGPTTTMNLGIGELWVHLTREDGEVNAVSLNLRAPTELVVSDAGLELGLDTRPRFSEVHAGMMEWPEPLDPGDLASVFRMAVPSLLEGAGDMFPSFPALEIPLGDFADVDGLKNTVWTLDDVEVEMHDSGWVKLTAELGER